ncbi:MAG: hypothetical protein FWG80_02705 [Alphaproteobacteria bacterium]|nr:hypothetical protein [Alphaproteobacteria bacterium]
MKKTIDIAYNFDGTRWKTAAVSIISLLKNRGNNHYFVHCVVTKDMFENRDARKQMENIVAGIDKDSKIEFIQFDPKKASIPYDNNMAFGGGICYWKQDFFTIFPKLDRIIYLDDDTIVLTPLDELANIGLGKNYLMAFRPGQAFRGIGDSKRYGEIQQYNAGVIIMNLKAIRESKIYKTFAELLKDKNLSFEQGLLAVAFKGRLAMYDGHTLYNYRTHADYATRGKKIAIIHYTGKKPWFFVTRKMSAWWKYAKMSPFYKQFRSNWIYNFFLYISIMLLPSKKMRHRLRNKYSRL